MSRPVVGESVLHLQSGECLLTSEPLRVVAVLGSGVAVTFHDPVSRLSAMCHASYPNRRCRGRQAEYDSPCRFVDEGVARLVERLERHGVPRTRLEVKIFGGSETPAPVRRSPAGPAMGRSNVKAAFDSVRDCGLMVQTSDVGGRQGRTLVFSTQSGEVLLRRQSGDDVRSRQGGMA